MNLFKHHKYETHARERERVKSKFSFTWLSESQVRKKLKNLAVRPPSLYKKRNLGFTLVELLIVIAIIGLLSSVVLASLNSARKKARDARRISDFRQFQTALEMFYDKTGFYPISASAGPWYGHWQNFATCLETGAGCDLENAGFTTTPTMSKVSQDPLFNGVSDVNTYFYGWPSGCYSGFPANSYRGQAYRFGVKLEIMNPATIGNDLDGSFYNGGLQCDDDSVGYCIGVGSCSGW